MWAVSRDHLPGCRGEVTGESKVKLIRRKPMLAMVPISATSQWRLEKKGLFPARRKISPGLVAWDEEEVNEWLRTRPVVEAGCVTQVEEGSLQGCKSKNQVVSSE
jgi:prophage regulatory protein